MTRKPSGRPSAGVDAAPRVRTPRTALVRSVGSFVPHLARKAFEKYGFSSAALLTDWAAIAGGEIASYAQPERLKWTRPVEAYGGGEHGAGGRPVAMLVLRVDGPRAIELQYKSRQILERVNAYFGYRAVIEMRFIQAPIEGLGVAAAPSMPRAIAARRGLPPELEAITDHTLRAALARLQANVVAEQAKCARAAPSA